MVEEKFKVYSAISMGSILSRFPVIQYHKTMTFILVGSSVTGRTKIVASLERTYRIVLLPIKIA